MACTAPGHGATTRTERHGWRNAAVGLVLAVLASTAVAGCQAGGAELPPLPRIDTTHMLPAVRDQLDRASDAVHAEPDDAEKNGAYAMALHAYDRSEAAFVLYARARLLASGDPRWPFYQSAVLQRLGDTAAALSALDDALRLAPGHIDVRAKRGEVLFLLNRPDEAEEQLTEVVEENPDYPLAQFYLARLHMERQDWETAADAFEHLLSRGLDVKDVHHNLGVALRMLGQAEAARAHLERAAREDGLTIASYDPITMVIADLNRGDQPHLLKARELYAAGDVVGATRELVTAVEKNPDSLGAHLHLIRFYAEQADVGAARRHYQKVMSLEPSNATAHASWGLALSAGGQHEAAIQAYQRAVELDPYEVEYRIAIANVMVRLSRHDEALVVLDEALRHEPDNRNARYLRGVSLLGLGRHARALVVFETLRDPDDTVTPMALRGIAVAQAALGRPEVAAQEIEAGLDLARRRRDARLVRYLEAEKRRLGEGAERE